jgi:DNA-binding NarL/FixJ family response regulator
MRNRTVIIATNAYFIAGVLMQMIIDNGLQAFVVDNDDDLEEKLKSTYPKFIFIENCFHGNGTDAYVHKLAKHNRYLRVVVWTACEVKPRFAVRFIEAGADSYLSLRDTDRNVKDAIKQISYGQHYYPADVESVIDKDFDNANVGRELTDRELVILKMALQGKSNKEMSKVLKIAECTIKTHKRSLYRKCGGTSLWDTLRNGLRKGFITVEDIT